MEIFHYLPDEILLKIFYYANDDIVDCLGDEFTGWERFTNERKIQDERDKAKCEALIPKHILTNYKKHLDYTKKYGVWKRMLKGWIKLSQNSQWMIKNETLKTFNDKRIKFFQLAGDKLYYIEYDSFMKTIDIHTKKETNIEFLGTPKNNWLAFLKCEGTSDVIPYVCFFGLEERKLTCINIKESRIIFAHHISTAVKVCNIGNKIFVKSRNSPVLQVFTLIQNEMRMNVLTMEGKIVDIETRDQELVILTTGKIIIWKNDKFIKVLKQWEHIDSGIKIEFFEDEILLYHSFSLMMFLVEETSENTYSLRFLGTISGNRDTLKIFLLTGHIPVIKENDTLELHTPEHTMKEVIDDPNVHLHLSLWHLKKNVNISYVNDTIYIAVKRISYYEEKIVLYKLTKSRTIQFPIS